jgi:hypothetical protein
MDLRDRHLKNWTPESDTHPEEHNSKRSTYHHYPTKRALFIRLTSFAYYILPMNTCFSTCLVSTAEGLFYVHSGGPFHSGWTFKTKEDWVAEKELLKEELNFDMAIWLHKYQPLLPHLDPDGQCHGAFARNLLGCLSWCVYLL